MNKINTLGFLDTGNNFFSAVSEIFLSSLGIPLTDLEPSELASVNQAGGGATLEILGKLPNSGHMNFSFNGLNVNFPLKDVYVLRGLDQNFNICLSFLSQNKFIIDLEENQLTYRLKEKTLVHIPFVQPSSPTLTCAILRPDISGDVTIPPQGSAIFRARSALEGGFLAPRDTRLKGPDQLPVQKGLRPALWAISEVDQDSAGAPANFKSFKVTNNSNKAESISNKFVLANICSIVLPNKDEVKISLALSESRKKLIRNKVKIEAQFEKRFLHNLHDLLFRLSDCISWDNKPGNTHLAETYISTGNAKPIHCPENRMNPKVTEIVKKQIAEWLRDNVIEELGNRGSPWNARLLVVPKKRIENEPQRYRVCVDLRHVNKCASIDLSPFAPFSIQETFHLLGRAKIFSTIDLTQAFCSIPIFKDHQFKTAFSFNGARYCFIKTPFGLSSAPAALGKCLNRALKNVP